MAGYSISDKINIYVYVGGEPSLITLSVENKTIRALRQQMIQSGYPNMENAIFKKHHGNQKVRIDDPIDLNNGEEIHVEFAAQPHVAYNPQLPLQYFEDVCCAKNGKAKIGGKAVVGTPGPNGPNQIFKRVIHGQHGVEVVGGMTVGGNDVQKPSQ